jgi:hypothetical protein
MEKQQDHEPIAHAAPVDLQRYRPPSQEEMR